MNQKSLGSLGIAVIKTFGHGYFDKLSTSFTDYADEHGFFFEKNPCDSVKSV